ncbi:hypothetical protein CPC08DRAFT_419571 [Agrocybe pediades]|nr:hypothetical protein CPC08DRAFT_419571 [Agrocybe pediades]
MRDDIGMRDSREPAGRVRLAQIDLQTSSLVLVVCLRGPGWAWSPGWGRVDFLCFFFSFASVLDVFFECTFRLMGFHGPFCFLIICFRPLKSCCLLSFLFHLCFRPFFVDFFAFVHYPHFSAFVFHHQHPSIHHCLLAIYFAIACVVKKIDYLIPVRRLYHSQSLHFPLLDISHDSSHIIDIVITLHHTPILPLRRTLLLSSRVEF